MCGSGGVCVVELCVWWSCVGGGSGAVCVWGGVVGGDSLELCVWWCVRVEV